MSRVLGLARDVIFAVFIGAAGGADAFFIAFKIPNFLRRLFAEGAFAQAFVPVLSEYRARGDAAAVRHLIDRVAGCLGMSVILVSLLAVVCASADLYICPGFLFWLTGKIRAYHRLNPHHFPLSSANFFGGVCRRYSQ